MHVLLVEPEYYTQYPPLGLLKISAYHKGLGDSVELVRGRRHPSRKPDIIYVTSLYTWAWKPVWDAVRFYKAMFPDVEVWLGGLYASLLPDHAAQSGADVIFQGLFKEAEDLLPDYSLVPNWDGSIIFASRGCNNNCIFCAVPKLEGKLNSEKRSIKHLIWPGHTSVIFWDNNFLQNRYWRNILDEVEELGLKVDFNQGLDASLITDEVAERLSKLKYRSNNWIRLGYDFKAKGPHVKKAIERLNAYGIRGKQILVYVLYNFTDDSQDFFERVRDVLEWGACAYPMRYEPIFTLEKNKYVSPKWTPHKLELVQKFRRIVGTRGVLPPYKALVEKFRKARDFDEAFSIWRKGEAK
jgi:hypothetical protein